MKSSGGEIDVFLCPEQTHFSKVNSLWEEGSASLKDNFLNFEAPQPQQNDCCSYSGALNFGK